MNKLVLILVVTLIFAGCNVHVPNKFNNGNFTVQAQLSSKGSKGQSTSTPSEYQVIVEKYELLKSLDDNNPVIIYAAGENEYVLVNLTSDTPTSLGSGKLEPGTYTHCRTTFIAISQTISEYLDGNESTPTYIKAFQDFTVDSLFPAEPIARGDVLVLEDGVFSWFEINQGKVYTHSTDKNSVSAYNVTLEDGEEVKVVEFTSPVTIEKGKKYIGMFTFEVDGTFQWEDIDNDVKFEPRSDDHDGNMNGFEFNINMSEITAYAITNE